MTFTIFCEENSEVTAWLLIVLALLARVKGVYQCHPSLNRCLFRTAQHPLDTEHNKSLIDNFLNFDRLTAVCVSFVSPLEHMAPIEETGGLRRGEARLRLKRTFPLLSFSP